MLLFFFLFTVTATTTIYTLSLHDARPIWVVLRGAVEIGRSQRVEALPIDPLLVDLLVGQVVDRLVGQKVFGNAHHCLAQGLLDCRISRYNAGHARGIDRDGANDFEGPHLCTRHGREHGEDHCNPGDLGGEKARVARATQRLNRSEERRVGKECRSRWSPYH